MEAITFTQLRTEPKKLKKALDEGKTVELIHRSRVVGEIRPKIFDPKPFNPDKFFKALRKLNLKPISVREARRRYRKHLMEKYGKSVPRH